MTNEIFCVLEFYPQFALSNHGRCISIDAGGVRVVPYVRDGYKHLRIDGKWYAVHRLVGACFLPPPSMPNPAIDHINRDRGDNCVENLRWVSVADNNRNRSKQAGTTSKYKGVYFSSSKQRYIAEYYYDGKKKRIGSFLTQEEAGDAIANFSMLAA